MGHRSQPRWDKSKAAWYCRYRKRKHYLGKNQAAAFRRFAQIVDGEVMGPVRTVAAAVTEWQARNGNDWTKYLLGRWTDFAGTLTLGVVNDEHLTTYVTWLTRRKYKPESVRHFVRYARTVCRWCTVKGFMSRVPAMPKTPTPVRSPKDVDADQLATTFRKLSGPARPLLEFILETGCRPGEGRLLRWDEVDINRSVAVLDRHKMSQRTGRVRTLVLTPAAKTILMSVPTASHGTGYVFLSRYGRPYSHAGVRSALCCAGIGSVYSLRHTRAQSMLDAGVSAEEVAAWLGHSNLSTVQVYCHVRASRLQEVARTLPSLLRAQPPAEALPGSAPEPESPKAKPATRRKSGAARRYRA